MTKRNYSNLDKAPLVVHRTDHPGKIDVVAAKPFTTQRYLVLAYSPSVAAPCLEVADHLSNAFDCTATVESKPVWPTNHAGCPRSDIQHFSN